MSPDSTGDAAPTETLLDFVTRFSSAFSLQGDGDRTTNAASNVAPDRIPESDAGQTGSTAHKSINQSANYHVSIPTETGDATDTIEAVEDPSSIPPEAHRLQASERKAARDSDEAPVPSVSELIVTEVTSSKELIQTSSATGPIYPSPSPPTTELRESRRANSGSIGARSGKFIATDPNAVINGWKSFYGLYWRSTVVRMPSSDARTITTSASSILLEPSAIQAATIPSEAQREAAHAEDEYFRVKIPLHGRLPLELEPKLYSLSALRMRKNNRMEKDRRPRPANTRTCQLKGSSRQQGKKREQWTISPRA
ncbi:MAG: hypothetical protein Q9195_002513 [Heterodermia aff. obscurata]